MKYSKLLKTLALSSALVTVSVAANANDYEMTGQEKIDYLINSIGDIQARINNSSVLTVGAVGYAAIGGVTEDGALNEGIITG